MRTDLLDFLQQAVIAQSRCETSVSNPVQGVRAGCAGPFNLGWRGEFSARRLAKPDSDRSGDRGQIPRR